jgi:ATP-dependent DNA helicase PIF1
MMLTSVDQVESNLFFRVDAMMKAARGSAEPFGGVQVIITGDFCQLPPVRPFENCVHCGSNVQKTGFGQKVQWECKHGRKDHPQKWSKGDEWAFNSTAWKEANFVNVYLKTIHRQSDKRFLELLNRCRFGKRLSDADIELVARPGNPDSPSYASAVRLMCVNKDVDKVNTSEFDKLDTPDVQTYLCLDNYEWVRGKGQGKLDKFAEMVTNNETGRETLKEFKDHRFPAKLKLRIGTVVALVMNMDLAAGLCNGSQGVVIGFEPFESTAIRVHTENMDIGKANLINNWVNQYRPRSFPIVRFNAAHGRPEVRRTIYPECFISSKKEKGANLLLSRAQIPLIQSWASEYTFSRATLFLNQNSY